MKKFEMIILAEKLEDVTAVLEANGLKPDTVKSIEASAILQEIESKPRKPCCGQDKALPSLSKRALAYIKLMKAWRKLGRPQVDRDEQLRRLAICNTCDDLNSDWHCSKCGCPMKEKVEMDMENLCDENKW